MADPRNSDSVEANLKLDKKLTGGNSANQNDTAPKTKTEQANMELQEALSSDKEEGTTMRMNIYQQPRD